MLITKLREDGLKSLVIMEDAPRVFDDNYTGDATSLIVGGEAAAAANPAADPENPAADPENPAADPENPAAAPASAAPVNDVPVQAFSGAHIDPHFFPSADADPAVRQQQTVRMNHIATGMSGMVDPPVLTPGSLARIAAEALARQFETPLPGNGEAFQEYQPDFQGVEACPTLLPHPSAPPFRPTPLPHPSAPPLCPTPLPHPSAPPLCPTPLTHPSAPPLCCRSFPMAAHPTTLRQPYRGTRRAPPFCPTP
jgi:hypothetical protein